MKSLNRENLLINLSGENTGCGEAYLKDEFESYVIEYYGDILGALEGKDYACAILINPIYAILGVKEGNLERVLREVPNIANYEGNRIYTVSYISPLDAANIIQFHNNPYLNLKGDGVIVGLVDTGIDYLNKEFINEDGTTRILEIWDQTVSDLTPPPGFYYGTVYDKDEINLAIAANSKNEDPYKIVNSKDEYGHGTVMAGIIGGKGYNGIVGAAPNCEFVVVKMSESSDRNLRNNGLERGDYPVYQTTDIMLALKYLYEMQRKYDKPMIIYLPLASNYGGHDGSSILERYMDSSSTRKGTLFITTCGNQGESQTHYRGKLENSGDVQTVELNVAYNQKNLAITIWCSKPDKISIGFVSPSGEIVERIPAKIKKSDEIKLVFEGSRILVRYDYPNDFTGDENIDVLIQGIRGGVWQIKIFADYIVYGDFDLWIYQQELLGANTRFLNSDPYITLTIPSTSFSAITTSYYNQTTNSIVIRSGRGFTRDNRIKPDVTAGGVDVKATSPGGEIVEITGSSAAGAVLTGAMALFYQWAIVEKNEPNIYSAKVRSYIIRGN